MLLLNVFSQSVKSLSPSRKNLKKIFNVLMLLLKDVKKIFKNVFSLLKSLKKIF